MRKQAPIAPPLCSVCNQKSPEFGKPVRRFTYAELQEATDNFNTNNYLAQGGYGSVFKGILQEGQLIAVKQHKIASSQGDKEFCAEVEVLSCAQHRNLVTLIGYCVEDHLRLLVYEFVCNGSLDRHLSCK
jgi:serine/threonine protein kinase